MLLYMPICQNNMSNESVLMILYFYYGEMLKCMLSNYTEMNYQLQNSYIIILIVYGISENLMFHEYYTSIGNLSYQFNEKYIKVYINVYMVGNHIKKLSVERLLLF
jgi:hypothetical protein